MQIAPPADPTSPQQMVAWLIQLIANEKKIPASQIDIEIPFSELGLDSMAAVTLSGDIETALNVELQPTLFWDLPNILALAQFLTESVQTLSANKN